MPGTELLALFIGSVALLLWGVRMVRTGMTRAFGAALRSILSKHARTRPSGFVAGIGVAGVLQSSTATALLLASFASRGLIALPIALSVILGADVGSSIAAQVFSFDIKWLWTLLVAGGVFGFMVSEQQKARGACRIAIGLGLMLLSLTHLTGAASLLKQSEAFRSLLSGLSGEPILAFLFAAASTWLAHSSLSIVLLIMSLATVGVIAAPVALALVLGANVGGAIAPLLSLSGAPPSARRVPLGNLIMRSATALPALFLAAPIATFLSPLISDPGRLAISFHLAFNFLTALLWLPAVGFVASMAQSLMPEALAGSEPGTPKHLDINALENPSEALACAMRETLHMGDRVAEMLRDARTAIEETDLSVIRAVERADDAVDQLHEAIKLYLMKASKAEMSEHEGQHYVEILTFTTNLEHIGDIIDKGLMELAAKKIKKRITFSAEGLAELAALHAKVTDNMRLAFNVFATRDLSLARRLLAEKTTMRVEELEASESHFARLRQGRLESIESSSIHLDIIRDLKRINGHLVSAAYPILEAAGEVGDIRSTYRLGVCQTVPKG